MLKELITSALVCTLLLMVGCSGVSGQQKQQKSSGPVAKQEQKTVVKQNNVAAEQQKTFGSVAKQEQKVAVKQNNAVTGQQETVPAIKHDFDFTKKKFVGQFVLRRDLNLEDSMVLNNLTIYTDQDIKNKYKLYHVYCDHDHSSDYKMKNVDASVIRMYMTGYVLSPYWETDSEHKIIVSDIVYATKGAWVFNARSLKVYDLQTKKEIKSIEPSTKGDELYRNSAAHIMANATSPHPGLPNVFGTLNPNR